MPPGIELELERGGRGGTGMDRLRACGRQLARFPRAFGFLPPLVWMLVIWRLSALEGETAQQLAFGLSFFGNFAHAPMFGVLALAFALLARRSGDQLVLDGPAVAAILTACVAYGVLDEWHQLSVPGRAASVFDVATDAVGAAAALWLAHYVSRADASTRGLIARLGGALLLCLICAWVASL